MANIHLKESFADKSPLEQLAAASFDVNDMIERGLLGQASLDGLEEIHRIQGLLKLHGWKPTDIDTYTKLEARVYTKMKGCLKRYALLTVGNFLGIFGELEIRNRKP